VFLKVREIVGYLQTQNTANANLDVLWHKRKKTAMMKTIRQFARQCDTDDQKQIYTQISKPSSYASFIVNIDYSAVCFNPHTLVRMFHRGHERPFEGSAGFGTTLLMFDFDDGLLSSSSIYGLGWMTYSPSRQHFWIASHFLYRSLSRQWSTPYPPPSSTAYCTVARDFFGFNSFFCSPRASRSRATKQY
jgi:hypothetical protein